MRRRQRRGMRRIPRGWRVRLAGRDLGAKGHRFDASENLFSTNSVEATKTQSFVCTQGGRRSRNELRSCCNLSRSCLPPGWVAAWLRAPIGSTSPLFFSGRVNFELSSLSSPGQSKSFRLKLLAPFPPGLCSAVQLLNGIRSEARWENTERKQVTFWAQFLIHTLTIHEAPRFG